MAGNQDQSETKPRSLVWSIARVLAISTGVGLALGVFYVALLALVLSTTSDQRIITRLHEAADVGVFEGKSYPRSRYGHGGHRYDMYTECVALGMNLANPERNVLRQIAASPTAGREGGEGPCQELSVSVRSGTTVADHGYMRFWHGYQVYMRPLLQFISLAEMTRLTAILFFATMIFFAWRLSLLFGPWAWAISLLPFFALSDFLTAPLLATHALSLIWAFLPAALVPIILERCPNARTLMLPLFVFVAGSSYNFLNFLINPPLAPALIAFIYIAANWSRDEKAMRQTALYAAGLSALWFCGFASAWLLKWVYTVAVLGPDAVLAELQRTFTKYEATRDRLQVNFLGATRRNVEYGAFSFSFILGSIAIAGAMWLWLVRKYGDWRARLVQFLALMTPLFWIILWVEANRAHSAEHVGFVSRSFLLFGIFPLLAVIKMWRDAKAERRAP